MARAARHVLFTSAVSDGKGLRAAPPDAPVVPAAHTVLLVGHEQDWPTGLKAGVAAGGYVAGSIADVGEMPSALADGRLRALLVFARPLGASEVLALRRVREASPRTAIVVVTTTPTDPDLKRAFECGATAFLSWPASPRALRHALESGVAVPRSNQMEERKRR